MIRVRHLALPALLLLLWNAGSVLSPTLGLVAAKAASPAPIVLQLTPESPLATPAQATSAPAAPTVTPQPTGTPTSSPTPSPSPTPTSTDTPIPTPTVAPFQVSPLVVSTGDAPPNDGSLLWIGAAALIVLVGSTVLLLAQRQGRS